MSTEHIPSPNHPTQDICHSVDSSQSSPAIQELPIEPDGSVSPNVSESNTPYQTPESDSTFSSNRDVVYDYSTVIINQDEVVVLERKTPAPQDSYGEDSNSNTVSQQDTDYTNIIVSEAVDNTEFDVSVDSTQDDVNGSIPVIAIQEVEIESLPQDKEADSPVVPSQESTSDQVTPIECSQLPPTPTQDVTMECREFPSDPPQDTDSDATHLSPTPDVVVTQEQSYRDSLILTQSQDMSEAVSLSAPAGYNVSSHTMYTVFYQIM